MQGGGTGRRGGVGSDNSVIASVLSDFERFAHGSDLAHCPELAMLFDFQGAAALAFASTFAGLGMAALARDGGTGVSPLAERVVDGEAQVVLSAEGQARIVLVVHSGADPAAPPGASPDANIVTFHPRESWRHFLSGRGWGERFRCAEPGSLTTRIDTSSLDLGPGTVVHELGPRETMRMAAVDAVLVELRLERTFAASLPVRRYDVERGRRVEEIAIADGASERLGQNQSGRSLSMIHRSRVTRWLARRLFRRQRGGGLSDGPVAGETLLRAAVALGGDTARATALHLAEHHAQESLRLCAFEALASQETSAQARDDLWKKAEQGPNRRIAVIARKRRAGLR